MKISTRSQYALRAMAYLARKGDFSSVQEIAQREKIPSEYLGKILSELKKARLLKVKRGVKGGYLLSQPPAKISVGKIMHSLDDLSPLVPCFDFNKNKVCPQKDKCLVKNLWYKIKRNWESTLNSLTLSEILK